MIHISVSTSRKAKRERDAAKKIQVEYASCLQAVRQLAVERKPYEEIVRSIDETWNLHRTEET